MTTAFIYVLLVMWYNIESYGDGDRYGVSYDEMSELHILYEYVILLLYILGLCIFFLHRYLL